MSFSLKTAAETLLPTFVPAIMDRIPGFGNDVQLNGVTDPAALSALVRDIVGLIIKGVIGPIGTQLDEVLRRLDDIEADSSASTRSSVTGIVVKSVKEVPVPSKDKIDVVLRKLSDVGVKKSKNCTTESVLKEFLQDVGIKDASCPRLISKDGKMCRTSAFRASYSNTYKDLFYDLNN